MGAHPDFAGKPLPRHATAGRFRLEVLSPAHVDEDFEAVTQSESILAGLFGSDWPSGLTLEKNHEDLQRHATEFRDCHAFAWIIRSADGGYLGCAYFKPEPGRRGLGKVYTWIRDRDDRLELLAEFNAAFADWLSPFLPEGFTLGWASNDAPGAARH